MNCSMEWREKENLEDPEDQRGVAIFHFGNRGFTYRASSFDNAQYVRRMLDTALLQGELHALEVTRGRVLDELDRASCGWTSGEQQGAFEAAQRRVEGAFSIAEYMLKEQEIKADDHRTQHIRSS